MPPEHISAVRKMNGGVDMFKKIRYNSPVVLTFAFISLASLLLGYLTKGWTTQHFFCVRHTAYSDPLTYVRMICYVFGHEDYQHFIANIPLLLVIGPTLEEKYGSKRLLIAMLVTALIGGVVQFFVFPSTALLGASGIVYMLIILASLGGITQGTIPLTMIIVALFYIGGAIIDGIFVKDNISQLTHVIGGVCGGAFGYLMVNRGVTLKQGAGPGPGTN